MKRILIVKPVMTISRYHFSRTIELSKYFQVTWLIHHYLHKGDVSGYNLHNHLIVQLGERPRANNFLANNLYLFSFYFKALKEITSSKYDLILVHSERLCFLLPLLNKKSNFVLMLFTASVSGSKIRRYFGNMEERINTVLFKKILVASDWMTEIYNLRKKIVLATKWGDTRISTNEKIFNEIKMIYLGTLSNRNLHETVEGLGIFIRDNCQHSIVSYDIIGTGKQEYIDMINAKINEYNLNNIVRVHGFLNDDDIKPFFNKCNLGVAYVPITEYYTNVVATKLYEYLLSGMAVIATATNENAKIVNKNNGVLIQDNPESFCVGLKNIVNKMPSLSSNRIFVESNNKTIEFCVKNYVVPVFNKFINS